MKKLIIALGLFFPTLFLMGCAPTTVYSPGYNNDYVYSVGYYNYRPYYWNKPLYWGRPYYWGSSYGWRNISWPGHRGVYGYRGWYNRGW
ncbi:TPA: hypothetical protein ACPSKE_001503 [Legionella feeleii]|uniref:Lipoprotein n=1 Tax=Legionella feeleii TaxID=453 RepID=A0A0W0TN80_9GAMM|nr:hypothetical protein [Legionella feeleii]KTC97043.1 hypothetical protein Lfee_1955 [Legionella feeleii]SPX61654.1 Uncharacterised protein [Legionella feeleii]STX37154.1 Uncharacterised protein [Legionella feeleii]